MTEPGRAAGRELSPECAAVWDKYVYVSHARQAELFEGPQGTPSWCEARMHRVGASKNLQFLGESDKGSREEALLSMAYADVGGGNYFTAQGSRNEPRNRGAVLKWLRDTAYGGKPIEDVLSVDCGLLVWAEHPCMSCSSDGHIIVVYEDGTYDVMNSELKCPVVTGGYGGEVPPEHRTQMLQQMGIHARSPGFGPLDLAARMVAQWAATDPEVRGDGAAYTLAPDWSYKTLYATWQRGVLLHVSLVPYDDAAFRDMAEAIISTYYDAYLPILCLLDAGRIAFPQLDEADPVIRLPAEDVVVRNELLGNLDELERASTAGSPRAAVEAEELIASAWARAAAQGDVGSAHSEGDEEEEEG